MKTNGQSIRTRSLYAAIAFLVLFVMALPAAGEENKGKPRLYLKFSVMGTDSNGGDFGRFADHSETYFDSQTALTGYAVTMNDDSFFKGYNCEIGIEVKRFAVGLSAGYLSRSFTRDTREENLSNGNIAENFREYRFTAYPIFLFIHYRLFETKMFNAYLSVGEGVYIGKLTNEQQLVTTSGDTVTSASSLLEIPRNQLGFHIGATFDVKVTSFLSVCVEAGYRIVNFKELNGENIYESGTDDPVVNEGDLYYWYNTRTGEPRFRIGDDIPGGNWEASPAVLDLNGFTFGIGLKISFGSGKAKTPPKVAPVGEY